ncbi:MAG: ATP-binding cassette domain-containing protein [Deltaproteobacteria bacterium]|nr:ATP-binding cassette domain-containing protein [Deltaproteobacteria bacterium]
MNAPLIEFKNVTKRFDNRTILDAVNLKIYEGEVTSIIGKSGTGKSVLLKHIIGLLKPDDGEILLDGKPMRQMRKSEREQHANRTSYMFQNNALFDSMTVFDNLALPLVETTKLSRREINKRVADRIEQVELTEVVHKYPSELSGGMQKRVALGRALVTNPKIVLFDEPTTGQDPIRRNAILSMIAEYQKKFGFTAVLISHALPDVFFISNRILALYEGKIIFEGTAEAFDNFEHPFMDELIESLEGLQEHLTGVYSKRHFKVRYQRSLTRKNRQQSYIAAVFTLENFDLLCENLGHTTGQLVVKSLGDFINKHFDAVGGFAGRHRADQFRAILPFSDLAEADRIMTDIGIDLRDQGLTRIQAKAKITRDSCFQFAILSGFAKGESGEKIETVFNKAMGKEAVIAQVECEMRR